MQKKNDCYEIEIINSSQDSIKRVKRETTY